MEWKPALTNSITHPWILHPRLNVVILVRTNLVTKAGRMSSYSAVIWICLLTNWSDYYTFAFFKSSLISGTLNNLGLEDFMNTYSDCWNPMLHNLSLLWSSYFKCYKCKYYFDDPDFSVLDLKAHLPWLPLYARIIKILPQKTRMMNLVAQLFRNVGRFRPHSTTLKRLLFSR